MVTYEVKKQTNKTRNDRIVDGRIINAYRNYAYNKQKNRYFIVYRYKLLSYRIR